MSDQQPLKKATALQPAIPGSRLNAKNPPGTRPRPYCNCQPLKKFRGSNEPLKICTVEPVYSSHCVQKINCSLITHY